MLYSMLPSANHHTSHVQDMTAVKFMHMR